MISNTKVSAILFASIAAIYYERVAISQAMLFLADEAALDASHQGWVFSAFSWGYVFFMLPGGLLVRRYGAWRCLLMGVLVSSLLSFSLTLATSFFQLFWLRFLLGAAEAPVFPACAAIVATRFSRGEFGWATASFDAGSYAGGAVVGVFLPYIMAEIGWRPPFFFSLLPAILVLIVYKRFSLIDEPIFETTRSDQMPIRMGSLCDLRLIGLSLSFMCYNFSKSFYLTWLPIIFSQFKSFNLFWLTLLSALPFLVAIASDFVGAGFLDTSDRHGHDPIISRRTLIFSGLSFSLLVTAVFFTDSKVLTVAVVCLSFAGLIAASPAYWSLPRELALSRNDVPIIGASINFVSNAGGVLSPLLIGATLQRSSQLSFSKVGLLLGASSLLGAALVCLVRPRNQLSAK